MPSANRFVGRDTLILSLRRLCACLFAKLSPCAERHDCNRPSLILRIKDDRIQNAHSHFAFDPELFNIQMRDVIVDSKSNELV
jgi:hypothetical protein